MQVRRGIVTAIAATVAAAVLLSGCAAGAPNQAATVGSSAIPVSLVESIYDAYLPILQKTVPADKQELARKSSRVAILRTLIFGNAALQVAKDQGLAVSQDEVNAVIATDPFAQSLAAQPALYPYVEAWATPVALSGKAPDKKAFQEAALKKPVQVNPRYGNWTLTTQLTEESLSGSLSIPVGGAS